MQPDSFIMILSQHNFKLAFKYNQYINNQITNQVKNKNIKWSLYPLSI